MIYKQLSETFNMLASNKPDCFVMDYAEHDELGIDLSGFELTTKEIRMLAEMGGGWGLGSDDEFDEEEMKAWTEPQNHTDEEIVEVNQFTNTHKL